MPARYPERIVCLTEETVETLYLLGEQDRIVGISGFTVRPPEARRTKPKVSAFTSAKHEKILALEPDLVIGFSDLQADIAAELVRRGANVYIANHRSVAGILEQILLLASMVGANAKGEALVERLEARIAAARAAAADLPKRPRVYFEEWDEPMISAIRWVVEVFGAGFDGTPMDRRNKGYRRSDVPFCRRQSRRVPLHRATMVGRPVGRPPCSPTPPAATPSPARAATA